MTIVLIGCVVNDLFVSYDVWCGWFTNVECNCKYVNVIAMVLQYVRSVLL